MTWPRSALIYLNYNSKLPVIDSDLKGFELILKYYDRVASILFCHTLIKLSGFGKWLLVLYRLLLISVSIFEMILFFIEVLLQ